jgi:hypothetical protein
VSFALGATVPLANAWDGNLGVGVGSLEFSDDEYTSHDWLLRFSLAAVWQPHRGRSGFFVGPKLTVMLDLETSDGSASPQLVEVTLGAEIGYRWQLQHFTVSLLLPALNVGHAFCNGCGDSTPSLFFNPIDATFAASRGWIFGVDLDLLRLGVAF